MTSDASEAALLERYRGGDSQAFSQLVHRHQSSLLRHAGGLLGPGRGVEDVVQEAFLRLAQSPPELDADTRGNPAAERAQLSSWLHKVTRNLCMDLLRSEGRRARREREVAASEAAGGGIDRVDARDTRAAVERSLHRLPDDQREVLVLRLLGDKSYREIADITGRKIGTVGWLISVGLKALGAELAPLLGRPDAVRTGGMGLDVARGELS